MQIVTREDGRVVACAQSGLLGGVEAPVPGAWAGGMAGINPLDWRLDNGALVYDPLPAEDDPLEAAMVEVASLAAENAVRLDEADAALVELAAIIAGEDGGVA